MNTIPILEIELPQNIEEKIRADIDEIWNNRKRKEDQNSSDTEASKHLISLDEFLKHLS